MNPMGFLFMGLFLLSSSQALGGDEVHNGRTTPKDPADEKPFCMKDPVTKKEVCVPSAKKDELKKKLEKKKVTRKEAENMIQKPKTQ
jgi:hypothetical protein